MRQLLLLCLLVISSAAVWADEGNLRDHAPADALAGLLEQSGHVLLIRHTLAPGTGDPPGFRLGECATQRNLSAQGREQARSLGLRLHAEGITAARIFSSQWCRCLETAELLGLGPVVALPALNSFFQEMRLREERTRELLDFLHVLPEGLPVVMVTHQVNISALTGSFSASGTGVVARIGPEGVHAVRTWP